MQSERGSVRNVCVNVCACLKGVGSGRDVHCLCVCVCVEIFLIWSVCAFVSLCGGYS